MLAGRFICVFFSASQPFALVCLFVCIFCGKDFVNPLATGVTYVTPGKINIAGCPTGVMLDRSLHSDFVASGGQRAGQFLDWPACRF